MGATNPQATVEIVSGDLPDSVAQMARSTGLVACDIETSGLSPATDRIATCQVFIPGTGVFIVRVGDVPPGNLMSTLRDESILKLFHHATFDLGFMAHHWGVIAAKVKCTKIASKILEPERESHSLKTLLLDHLGVDIDKAHQTSDWLSRTLSEGQISYAAADVLHLPDLIEKLESDLGMKGRKILAQKCFDFLPTRVRLDLLGCGDVFKY